jgi:NADH-quinone oxidoreductase subunit F
MHAAHILEFGPAAFRRVGGPNSPGTFLVTLSGDIERPGIYEIPLGTTVSELVFRHGGGIPRGRACLTVFPGGLTEPPLSENELAKALDYEGMYEAQTSLGAGVVVVVSDAHDPVDLTESLARAYSQISCGKCRPCSDGTKRIAVMLSNLDRLDERGIDRNGQMSGAKLHASSVLFPIITKTQPLSYTDTKQGLEKITHLCEFVKHRGDCQFPVGAMTSIQRLMHTFHEGFDARRQSSLPAATEAPPSVSALSRATASRLRNKEGSLTT